MSAATAAVGKNWMRLCVPWIVTSFVSDFVYELTARLQGHAKLWVGFLTFITVTCPLCWLSMAAISYMFVREQVDGEEPRIENAWEVARFPGLVGMMVRLGVRFAGWLLPASAAFVLLIVLGVIFRGVTSHAGSAGAHGRGGAGNYAAMLGLFVVWEVLLSRYMFVLPLFVHERGGGQELFRRAVEAAKPYRTQLWTLAAIETLAFILPYHYASHALSAVPRSFVFNVGWRTVYSALTAPVAVWFVVFKVALMLNSRPVLTEVEDGAGISANMRARLA